VPIKTAGRLFLFGNNFRAVTFFDSDPANLRDKIGNSIYGFPVRHFQCFHIPQETWPRRGPKAHAYAHEHLNRNRCIGEPNNKKRRNGGDSDFSGMMRAYGCYDTPFIDIDAIETHEGRVMLILEYKKPGERTDGFQDAILKHLGGCGPVEV
jgi:hypothetical protein